MVAGGLHRRATVSVTLEYGLFTRFKSAENWDVNATDSYKEFIQLVLAGAVYLFLLPKYCLLPG